MKKIITLVVATLFIGSVSVIAYTSSNNSISGNSGELCLSNANTAKLDSAKKADCKADKKECADKVAKKECTDKAKSDKKCCADKASADKKCCADKVSGEKKDCPAKTTAKNDESSTQKTVVTQK